jgi:uncharacterized protein (TIGR03083 family)
MQPLQPVLTAPLFRPLLDSLLALLRTLSADDWHRPTVPGRWRVRDVAAHLLDGDLRRLAACRDAHLVDPGRPIASDRDLAGFINRLNASGVDYATRLSPRLLTELLAVTGGWVAELVEAQDPHGRACFAVSWAGETTSENWMDTGREYTERWHHQAQIRDALGVRLLLEPRWLDPLMDISVRALPVAYAALDAPDGTAISLVIRGTSAPGWTIERNGGRWRLLSGVPDAPHAGVMLEADAAWRLFYNALPEPAVTAPLAVEGDRALLQPLLTARSVIL